MVFVGRCEMAKISYFTNLARLVGYQKVSFNESDFEDDSAFKWRVSWNWKPVETLDFSFISERDFDEANRLTDSYRLVGQIWSDCCIKFK